MLDFYNASAHYYLKSSGISLATPREETTMDTQTAALIISTIAAGAFFFGMIWFVADAVVNDLYRRPNR